MRNIGYNETGVSSRVHVRSELFFDATEDPPICGNCRFFKDHGDDGEGYCKKRAGDFRKKDPWPTVLDGDDGCGDHRYMKCSVPEFIDCGDPTCRTCKPGKVIASNEAKRPKPQAAMKASPPAPVVSTPKPGNDNDAQSELRSAYAAVAERLGRPDVPLADVRDHFKAHHRVTVTDPKAANKKKLDAWAWAKRRLPDGLEIAGDAMRPAA